MTRSSTTFSRKAALVALCAALLTTLAACSPKQDATVDTSKAAAAPPAAVTDSAAKTPSGAMAGMVGTTGAKLKITGEIPAAQQLELLVRTKQEVELGRRLGDHILTTLQAKWNPPRDGRRDTPVRINTIGFFYDSPDCGAFLWALARANNGNFVGMSRP